MFQAFAAESPAAMRRRFLLERSAWRLSTGVQSVTEIAFDAQYESLEGFCRAFRKAFGMSPTLFRRAGCLRIHLPAPNEYHFCPPGGHLKGDFSMDLFELFAGTEAWHTRLLLTEAMKLTDEQLDRPLPGSATLFAWGQPDRCLRETLERIVVEKEVWNAALLGGKMPSLDARPAEERTAKALLDRFERAETDFLRVFKDIRARNAWDETFVDALCEPPETFTYGGVFGSIVMYNGYRRLTALDSFQRLGVKVPGSGCPINFQESMAAAKA